VSGQYGIWRSSDNAATWQQISDYPLGIMDGVQTIAGDPSTFGKVYVGFGGIGFVYGQIAP
jgi:drug/metabolite transporter superfamily protein YnfA